MTTGVLKKPGVPGRKTTTCGGSVLLLAPQIYAHGGVQSYMRRLAVILTAYCGGSGHTCVSLAIGRRGFREVDGSQAGEGAPPVVDAFGCKLRMVANAFQAAWRTRARIAVVGHTGLGPVAFALKACGLIRSYVVVLHGIEAWQRLSMADRIAARCASLTIATTEFTARRFAEINGYPINRVLVVPLAVEEDSIPQPAPTRPCQDMRVLTVGRLSRLEQYKGVDHLIDAVAALVTTGTPVTLDIVGDGDDSPALKQRAIRSGASDAIRFHGAVSDERLRELYRSSDVFAMPSLNEGFGIVFLEAMRYGKPCIGGRHGGTPEVVQDGINGLLVQHGDVNHLIGCLRELYSNHNLRRRLGERAYHTVVGKFLMPRMRADWFRVLDTAFRASEQTTS